MNSISMTPEPQENRLLVLARFIRNQCGLVTQKGGKVVSGVGDVRLNHEEALLAADALERIAALSTEAIDVEKLRELIKRYDARVAGAEFNGVCLPFMAQEPRETASFLRQLLRIAEGESKP